MKSQVEDIILNNKKAKSILNATLAIIACGGMLTLGAIAPNVFSSLTKVLYKKSQDKKKRYYEIWKRFYRLKEQNYIKLAEEREDILIYEITEKGRTRLKNFIFDELQLTMPERWDQRWRVIIFDIPEPFKKARYALYIKLRELEFYQLQKSVWVHPLPCESEILFLKDFFNIHPFVHVLLVQEMPSGKALYHFKNLLREIS